jgi:hypothetical protein
MYTRQTKELVYQSERLVNNLFLTENKKKNVIGRTTDFDALSLE